VARQRFIWPSIWEDPELGCVSPLAFLLYVGCFSNADDYGKLRADPVYLKGVVFRYRSLSIAKVNELRDELEAACGEFIVYDIDGQEYISFGNWKDFQKPKYAKDSTIPDPPSGNVSGNQQERSRTPSSGVGSNREGKDKNPPIIPPRPPKTDELWDTLEAELGEAVTASERGRRNKALKELRDIGATPGEVRKRCKAYRRMWPDITLTATALAANWTTLVTKEPQVQPIEAVLELPDISEEDRVANLERIRELSQAISQEAV